MTKDVPSDNRHGTGGHGLEIALSVGAGDQYMLFPLGSPLDGSLTHGINGNFAMYVNKEGRRFVDETCPIDKAPFFACPRTPTVHIILGGLTCAGTGEVISTEGKPIPGLYAVGEITAGGAALSSFADGMMLGAHLFGK